MNIIEQIVEAVYELRAMNCKEEDLIISFSPLIERHLIEEMHKNYLAASISSVQTISGVKTYNLWPYNEIVVYDSKNVAYFPELIRKIEVSVGEKKL